MARLVKHPGVVHSLKYHLVWCPKYRRPVLTGSVESRLKEILLATAAEIGVEVLQMEVMPDHVRLFVRGDTTLAVGRIVNALKGASSHALREEFPSLRSRLPTLWSRSYYVGSVGHVSESTVRKYIAAQKGR